MLDLIVHLYKQSSSQGLPPTYASVISLVLSMQKEVLQQLQSMSVKKHQRRREFDKETKQREAYQKWDFCVGLQYINMYRQSNERYSEGGNMPMPYPPLGSHPSMPKMHGEGSFPPPGPPPLYYDTIPNYDYPPPPPDNYDQRSYHSQWRQPSQNKPNMGPSPNMGFERGPSSHGEFPKEPFIMGQSGPPPQLNVVQRISAVIKSQLPQLQAILAYADRKTNEERQKKDRSRSRSRERQPRPHREWNCNKCGYLNFDFRDRCKKCNDAKPEGTRQAPKGYVPGPDDWRCLRCNNINYARRTECHRCHAPRGK